jgi:hypothetical protein
VTLPSAPLERAGIAIGDRLRVEAVAIGVVVLTRIGAGAQQQEAGAA